MKSLYAACLSRLGLTIEEARHVHSQYGVPARLDTIKHWSAGRRTPPPGIWADLRAYEAKIIDRSEAIREAWEDAGEIRVVDIQTHEDPVALMAAADFLLSTDAEPPIKINIVN